MGGEEALLGGCGGERGPSTIPGSLAPGISGVPEQEVVAQLGGRSGLMSPRAGLALGGLSARVCVGRHPDAQAGSPQVRHCKAAVSKDG